MECIKVAFVFYCLGFVNGVKLDVRGLIPSVFTPYDGNGQVNYTVVSDYAKYLKKNGVHGALVGGTASEGPGLSLKERIHLLDEWIKESKPLGLKVVMQIGGMPMPEVLELARYADQVKPDALLTLPELYYKPDNVETLVRYMQQISEAAPSLPLLYYDHPSLSGVVLNMPKFFMLATQTIPNFKGIKCGIMAAAKIESSNDVSEEQEIFMASHAIRASSCMMGYNSSMSTISNIFPRLMLDIERAVRKNDLLLAKKLQLELNRNVATLVSNNEYVPSMKAAMEIISGIPLGDVRDPLNPLTKEQKCIIADKLNEINCK